MSAGPRSHPSSTVDSTQARFADLLIRAVNEPGVISAAYRQFHHFSFGNQLLAYAQCVARGITPGPLATFVGWKAKGRHVRKGEHALTLCMPITCKRQVSTEDGADDAQATFTRFVYKPHWFVLSQTDGAPLPPTPTPTWDAATALAQLGVAETPFDHTDGNVMGFARGRSISVSPVNPLPWKTRFHELAHVLLGHTSESDQTDGELTPRNLAECEAESVALVCCAALELPGVDFARGYIQRWWGHGNPIPERSAQRILKVADQILKAGAVDAEVREEAA